MQFLVGIKPGDLLETERNSWYKFARHPDLHCIPQKFLNI